MEVVSVSRCSFARNRAATKLALGSNLDLRPLRVRKPGIYHVLAAQTDPCELSSARHCEYASFCFTQTKPFLHVTTDALCPPTWPHCSHWFTVGGDVVSATKQVSGS